MSEFLHVFQGRRLRRLGLSLISVLLISLWIVPAWGQLIDLEAILNESSGIDARRIGNIDVAKVRLDGRPLFRVAAHSPEVAGEDVIPIAWRVKEIEFKLDNLVRNGFDPDSLEVSVTTRNNQLVIQVDDKNLEPKQILTVTELDGLIDREEETAANAAQRRAEILRTALLKASAERQPEYLQQQLGYGALTLLGMGIGTLAIARLQKYRRYRYQLIAQHKQQLGEDTIDAHQANAAAFESVTPPESSRRGSAWLRRPSLTWAQQEKLTHLMRWVLGVLQLSILFGGAAWISHQFPQTRPFGAWLLTLPLSLMLIPIAMAIVKGVVDWLILTSLTRWVEVVEEKQGLNNRTKLRIQTIWQVLQDLTLYLVSLVGILLFFSFINALAIGVLTLAIVGLASQNLIKDWLRGSLILLEDHYANGDVVQIGAVSGMVEFMNLRVTQLRSLGGELISIDHGSFAQAINFTSRWSQLNLGVDVDYQTNVDQAIKVVRSVADELYKDADWRSLMLEEPVVLGVDNFNESKITIRLLIKTQPMKQWDVGREYRRRLKPAFDQADISVPRNRHLVNFENAQQN